MRKWALFLMLVLSHTETSYSSDTLYQAGTLLNLTNGLYQGTTTLGSLYQNGDLGLGTTNGPEGEMVIINKQAYVADIKGNAHAVGAHSATPFAMIVNFKPNKSLALQNIHHLQELTDQLEVALPSKNIFYAIKVSGKFDFLRMRDWMKPTFPAPADIWIAKNQHINEYHGIDGTLVIFKAPEYATPITVGGYHIHFISSDHKKVGHVYDLQFAKADVQIQSLYHFNLILPDLPAFLKTNLKNVSASAITKLETNK